MLSLTKEATDKDRYLKTELTISSKSCEEKISGKSECGEMRDFLRIQNRNWTWKKYIPENCLFYINQSFISTVKNDELAMYHHNFVIGELIVTANQPAEINQYVCKDNEVKLYTCVYNLQTGKFLGLRLREVGFLVFRGDERELLLSYGFNSEKSSILSSSSKQKIPDGFLSTYG